MHAGDMYGVLAKSWIIVGPYALTAVQAGVGRDKALFLSLPVPCS